jgi:hypothetical protein
MANNLFALNKFYLIVRICFSEAGLMVVYYNKFLTLMIFFHQSKIVISELLNVKIKGKKFAVKPSTH